MRSLQLEVVLVLVQGHHDVEVIILTCHWQCQWLIGAYY